MDRRAETSAGDSRTIQDELRRELKQLLSLERSHTRQDYFRAAVISAQLGDAGWDDRWSERDAAELSALLVLYESLRKESLGTVNNRTQVMMLGLGAVLALGAGALAVTGDRAPLVHVAAFCYAVPLACGFILLTWLSEAVRAHRAGYFLASSVEARINVLLGRFAISWETSLWCGLLPRDEFMGPSMAAMVLVGLIAAGAPVVGAVLAGYDLSVVGSPIVHVWVPYSIMALTAAYVWSQRGRLLNIPTIRSLEHSSPSDIGQGLRT